jgi:O-antigen/teichoic acid export membrane protein
MNRVARTLAPTARQLLFLFAVDSFTNLVDYGFHVYLGRALAPGQFAIVQTVNAALLIAIAAFGVTQPVVARQVAEANAGSPTSGVSEANAVFQHYFRICALLGVALVVIAWLGRSTIASWLNVPVPVVALSLSMILIVLLRPVVAGMLQGQQRFVSFGITRAIHAVGRLAIVVVLLSLGGGILAAVAAFPAGAVLALLSGLAFVGPSAWKRGPALSGQIVRDGFRLSVWAFLAYAAYMSLLNSDLIWVNRSFASDTAGYYATAVLLRRVLTLMPGAVIVIMYPRIVARISRQELPDSLLWKAALVILASTLALTGLYSAFGPLVVSLAFGTQYVAAAQLLGWMGVAMLGYGLAAIWLNLYLATRPLPFALLLVTMALAQHVAFASFRQTLQQIIVSFVISGWALGLGGLLIYTGVTRAQLMQSWKEGAQ